MNILLLNSMELPQLYEVYMYVITREYRKKMVELIIQ